VGSAGQQEIRAIMVRDIGATCGTGIPIFEVGCGTGLMGQGLIAQGVTSAALYSGGDVSQSMLAIGRQRLPGCRLLDLDIFDLSPIPPQDNVICLHVLQHLPHYRDALAQLLRFARKQLYIATWFSASDNDEIGIGRDGPYAPTFHVNNYGISGFLAEIRNADRPVARLSERPLIGKMRVVHVAF
jgi:ubiquinone/menaquinone biosynthesis C-methylase UbiE